MIDLIWKYVIFYGSMNHSYGHLFIQTPIIFFGRTYLGDRFFLIQFCSILNEILLQFLQKNTISYLHVIGFFVNLSINFLRLHQLGLDNLPSFLKFISRRMISSMYSLQVVPAQSISNVDLESQRDVDYRDTNKMINYI